MRPIQIPEQSEEQIKALADLYRTTRNVRLRTRAQMVLLAVEQHLTAAAIAAIVRESEGTVRCWLKRYLVEGIAGLHDALGWRCTCQGDRGVQGAVASSGAASASQLRAALLDVDITAAG